MKTLFPLLVPGTYLTAF